LFLAFERHSGRLEEPNRMTKLHHLRSPDTQTHLALRRVRAIYPPQMVLNRTSMACRRVVIDDRSRLPGRFFGRFATSAMSELSPAL